MNNLKSLLILFLKVDHVFNLTTELKKNPVSYKIQSELGTLVPDTQINVKIYNIDKGFTIHNITYGKVYGNKKNEGELKYSSNYNLDENNFFCEHSVIDIRSYDDKNNTIDTYPSDRAKALVAWSIEINKEIKLYYIDFNFDRIGPLSSNSKLEENYLNPYIQLTTSIKFFFVNICGFENKFQKGNNISIKPINPSKFKVPKGIYTVASRCFKKDYGKLTHLFNLGTSFSVAESESDNPPQYKIDETKLEQFFRQQKNIKEYLNVINNSQS